MKILLKKPFVKNTFRVWLIILISFLLPFQVFTAQQKDDEPVVPTCQEQNNIKNYKLIVFIHGTIFYTPSPKAIAGVITDIISKFSFKKGKKQKKGILKNYYKRIRQSYYRVYQPIGPRGLVKIDPKAPPNVSTKTSKCAAGVYETLCQLLEKENNTERSYYTFGWNGRLSKRARKRSAQKLYLTLIDKINQLKRQEDKETEIELLCHSHGVNVALLLAKMEGKYKENLRIKNLYLFGGPVQSETENLIHSPVFEKIYTLYSPRDYIQVLDIISTKDLFSRRKFGTNKKKPVSLPDKLVQIKVTTQTLDPSHGELWFFGNLSNIFYKHVIYRPQFPLNPFPIFIFIPLIVHHCDTVCPQARDISLKFVTTNGAQKHIMLQSTYLEKVIDHQSNEKDSTAPKTAFTNFPAFDKLMDEYNQWFTKT
jgi:hypothetical protein